MAAIDNDVLHKGVCFGFLTELLATINSEEYGILDAARYIIPKKIEKRPPSHGSSSAKTAFLAFIASATLLQPNESELQFAAEMEEQAAMLGLAMDSGESQLCAMVIHRNLVALATGDKRAIVAIEQLLAQCKELVNRVYCLEQLILRLLAKGNCESIRKAICENAMVDRALANCFSCSSQNISVDQWFEGLHSYIENLRASSPTILAPN